MQWSFHCHNNCCVDKHWGKVFGVFQLPFYIRENGFTRWFMSRICLIISRIRRTVSLATCMSVRRTPCYHVSATPHVLLQELLSRYNVQFLHNWVFRFIQYTGRHFTQTNCRLIRKSRYDSMAWEQRLQIYNLN